MRKALRGMKRCHTAIKLALSSRPIEQLIACGQAVAVILPPTLRGGMLGEREQEIAPGP